MYDRIQNEFETGVVDDNSYNNSMERFMNQSFTPVQFYYHKHIPAPRTKKPEPVELEEPDQRNTPRTPDMYDFDF